MSIFGSLLGGAVGLLGQKLGNDDREEAAEKAFQRSRPISVSGPGGASTFEDDSLNLSLNPQLERFQQGLGGAAESALGNLRGMDFQGREAAELNRLRTLRRPEIDKARAALQSRLVARGRTGLGIGGGLSGNLFNPESAALEEAILRADLGDIGAARGFSQQEQNFLLGQVGGLSGIQQDVLGGPEALGALSVGGAPSAAVSTLQAQPGFTAANQRNDFFASLGQGIAGTDFRDLASRFSSGGMAGLFF